MKLLCTQTDLGGMCGLGRGQAWPGPEAASLRNYGWRSACVRTDMSLLVLSPPPEPVQYVHMYQKIQTLEWQ